MAMDQETDLLDLSGTVEAVIYKNEENGYKDERKNSVRQVLCSGNCNR